MTSILPLNRFITLVKPYVNVFAAALATWLVAKANVLGIPGLGDHKNELATGLTAAGVWLLTQGAAQLGDAKWMKGHHIELAAAASAAGTIPDTHGPHEEGLVDHSVEDVLYGELPSDDEERRSPPPAVTQPSQAGLTDWPAA